MNVEGYTAKSSVRKVARAGRVMAILMLAHVFIGQSSGAQNERYKKLAGLEAVYVIAAPSFDRKLSAAVKWDTLQREVEARLLSSRVPLYNHKNWPRGLPTPTLMLISRPFRLGDQSVVQVSLELVEQATVARRPTVPINVITFSDQRLLLSTTGDLTAALSGRMLELIDLFAALYAADNPTR